ncbi:MAG TPA: ABC transporter permease [Thermoanaerobaculia bacterium]|nr:ABC transporter permease [Thermoanaerobaculia bacterium]
MTLREGEPERLSAARVSADFFRAVAVPPALGGGLQARDDRADENRTAVLSHGLWQRHFGGEPGIVGRTIHLDAGAYTVVGVMPADFRFPSEVEVWVPLGLTPEQWADRDGHYLNILGRLAPGVSPARAQREMDLLSHRLAAQYPASDAGWTAQVDGLEDEIVKPLRPAVLVLATAGALLLAVVCGNFANLLLVRAASRGRELAGRWAPAPAGWRASC